MHEIIKEYLDEIEQHSKRIECCVQGIYGFCAGMAVVARDLEKQQANAETSIKTRVKND